mmetsp:Transcript_6384/g.9084  ORF Transcript_6384/g.9084 Transcript_6384/m.9084 type:complete len:132 (-) Transcript_6384:1151-1546(-)
MKTTIDTRKTDIDEDRRLMMKARSYEGEGRLMRRVQSCEGIKGEGHLMMKAHSEKHAEEDGRRMIGVQSCKATEGGCHAMKTAPEGVTSGPQTRVESSQLAEDLKGGEMATQIAPIGAMTTSSLATLLTTT